MSATLICLSELVPILGADTVIGGKRAKFFTDGRPNSKTKPLLLSASPINESNVYMSKTLRELPCSEDLYESDKNELISFEKSLTLNERPSPVGGESLDDEIIVKETHIKNEESEDDWSDWESTRQNITNNIPQVLDELEHEQLVSIEPVPELKDTASIRDFKTTTSVNESRTSLLQKAAIEAKKNILDITELDIKNQKYDYSKKHSDEFDFFADMTPVIEKPTITPAQDSVAQNVSSKFNFVPDENIDENEAWGEGWND